METVVGLPQHRALTLEILERRQIADYTLILARLEQLAFALGTDQGPEYMGLVRETETIVKKLLTHHLPVAC